MINNLDKFPINLGSLGVTPYSGMTELELLNQYYIKINELVNFCNDTNILSNKALDFMEWCKNEGIPAETVKIINEKILDGTLGKLINDVLLKDINNKVDENKNELTNKINTDIQTLKDEKDEDIRVINEQLDNNTSQINSIIQIPLTKYIFLVEDDDWSPAIESALKDNPEGEIFVPWNNKIYNFSRPIILGENNSLKVDIGATIRAISEMDIFIQRHGTLDNLTREYNFYNRIYGGGVIDCDGLAKTAISIGGYRGYRIKDLTILDSLNYGIITKYGEYAAELFADDLRIETRNERTDINATAMLVNSSDNHFSSIIMVDTLIGIDCPDYSNRFFRCHHWMRDRIANKDIGAISFKDTGSFNTYDTCYADTSNIGFETGGGNTFINCEYFNSQHFNATNVTAIKFNKEITSLLVFENFRVRGDGTVNVAKALDGTINANVRLNNCYCNHLVGEKFPAGHSVVGSLEADYIESLGDIRAKVLRALNKVQVPWLNFADDKAMTCNDDYILTLNGNVVPKFIGNAPLSSNSPGRNGEICYDNQYLYFRHDGLKKWGRIPWDFSF